MRLYNTTSERGLSNISAQMPTYIQVKKLRSPIIYVRLCVLPVSNKEGAASRLCGTVNNHQFTYRQWDLALKTPLQKSTADYKRKRSYITVVQARSIDPRMNGRISNNTRDTYLGLPATIPVFIS